MFFRPPKRGYGWTSPGRGSYQTFAGESLPSDDSGGSEPPPVRRGRGRPPKLSNGLANAQKLALPRVSLKTLSIGKIPSRAATVALAGERRASWSSDMQPYETLTVQQLFDYIRKNTSVTDDYALNEQALVLLSEATNSILELKNALFNRRPMMEVKFKRAQFSRK